MVHVDMYPYFIASFFIFLFYYYFFKILVFQPMTFAPDNSFLSSDHDINWFLIYAGIEP